MLKTETVQVIEEHDRTRQTLLEGGTWPGQEKHLAVCPICQKLSARLARLGKMTPKIPPPRRGLLGELMLVTHGVPKPRPGLLEDLRRATRSQVAITESGRDGDHPAAGADLDIDQAEAVEEAPEPVRSGGRVNAGPVPASETEQEANLDEAAPQPAAATDAPPAEDRGADLWTPNAYESGTAAVRSAARSSGPNHELRLQRGLRGWSQDDVAAGLCRLAKGRGLGELGVDATMVSWWERGTRSPRPRYVQLLSGLFGLPPERLGLVDADDRDQTSGLDDPGRAEPHVDQPAWLWPLPREPFLPRGSQLVAVVDHRPLVLRGLLRVIEETPDLMACAAHTSLEEAWRSLHGNVGAVVVINLDGPDVDPGALARLHREGFRVVGLTGRPIVPHEAMAAGVLGCLHEDASVGEFTATVRRVARGAPIRSTAPT